MNRPSKISNLQFTLNTQQQVLWLDITMNDMLAMQIQQRLGHLTNVLGRLSFRESAILAKLLVQLASGGVFKDQIDTVGVIKVAIKTEDVWMSTKGMMSESSVCMTLHQSFGMKNQCS